MKLKKRVAKSGRDSLNLTEIDSILEKFSSPFENFTTEAKRFSDFRKQGTFILPENYKLGEKKLLLKNRGKK